ncbi:MAG: amino acid ABC transporter substrate-binding protein [Anaerolineae bacterium]|nr:amino acid ABC transporter substrate-binding protein [Anaerolineae bacterium]
MRRILLILSLLAMIFVLAACSEQGGQTEVTRIVTVEVPVAGETTTEVQTQQVAVTFAGGGNTLRTVQERGVLKCGGNANVPGFGYLDPATGGFSGFDIDFCKAIAAAVLGNSEAIEVVPTTGDSRFPTLQSGEVDVLIRNTTWTLSRDTSLGFDFAPVTFFDGQGMMVRRADNISSFAQLAGSTICVQSGTTTEKNLADYFALLGINYTPLVFPDAVSTREAYDSGACDGFTTDKSGLVSQQILLADPTAHVILVEDMSREPLGPLTRHGDNEWNDIVSWVVYCTFNAEFLGVNQANVDSQLGSDNPPIAGLLGESGDYGQALGLNNDFCYQVVKQVGNYADIYNRNLGPDTPFDLPRGPNSLYTDGGLLYPIPFR